MDLRKALTRGTSVFVKMFAQVPAHLADDQYHRNRKEACRNHKDLQQQEREPFPVTGTFLVRAVCDNEYHPEKKYRCEHHYQGQKYH